MTPLPANYIAMVRKNESNTDAPEQEAPAVEPAAKKAPIHAVDVKDARSGALIRTYSREEHGDGFRDLAKMFASKKGRSVVLFEH